MWEKVKKWYRSLPDKKVYFELLGAVLTIPVLVTVILLNLNNLRTSKGSSAPVPSPQVIRVVETAPPSNNNVTSVPANVGGNQRVSPQQSCKREIGPVNISSPQEGQVMSGGQACVAISYKTGEYCAIVWAVKLDNGAYTDFSDKDICYSNLTNGSHTASVKIRSAADSSNEVILQRNFQMTGGVQPTPATTSAVLTPEVTKSASPNL